jgi:hypothetical protein
MKKCNLCGSVILFGGVSDRKEYYCSKACYHFSIRPRFCEFCIEETTSESIGSLDTINGTGWTMYGASNQCKHCFSDIRSVRFGIIGIPTFGKGKYRVKSYKNFYISRKLKNQ